MTIYVPPDGQPTQVTPGDLTVADRRRLKRGTRGTRGTQRGRPTPDPEETPDALPCGCARDGTELCAQHVQARRGRALGSVGKQRPVGRAAT